MSPFDRFRDLRPREAKDNATQLVNGGDVI